MGRRKYLPILADVLERRDLNPTQKLLLCAVSYWQGDNDWCWWKEKDIARALGLSLHTVCRTLSRLVTAGLTQDYTNAVNRNRGKQYRIANGALSGNRVFGRKSHCPKCTPYDNTEKEVEYFKGPSARISPLELSSPAPKAVPDERRVYFRLVDIGVNGKVAHLMAFDQLHPYESVDQAVKNCIVLRAWQQQESRRLGLPLPLFNLPGYVVRALNGARREGKIVGTTRLFREAAVASRAMKAARNKAASYRPPGNAKFEQRRQMLLDQLRTIQNEHRENRIAKAPETRIRDRAI